MSNMKKPPANAIGGRSVWGMVWFRFRKNKLAMAGLFLLLFMNLGGRCMSDSFHGHWSFLPTEYSLSRFKASHSKQRHPNSMQISPTDLSH